MTDVDNGEEVTFRFSLDDENEPVMTIVEGVAWVNNVDLTDLIPLQYVVDVDALVDLIRSAPLYRSFTASGQLEVRFLYEGCLITVSRDRVKIVPEDYL